MNNNTSCSKIDENLGIEIRYDNLYKIIIIGDSGVGKTSLITKYLTGIFPISPLPTLATEFATKVIQIDDGGYIKAQIWDTAGEEKYRSITYHHYKKCVGGLIVYDITNRKTFSNIMGWLNDLKELAERGCIIALVGNKLDLVEIDEKKREVTVDEAKMFAYLNHLLFFETSAYNSNNVNTIFEELIQTIYNERRKIRLQLSRANLGSVSDDENVFKLSTLGGKVCNNNEHKDNSDECYC